MADATGQSMRPTQQNADIEVVNALHNAGREDLAKELSKYGRLVPRPREEVEKILQSVHGWRTRGQVLLALTTGQFPQRLRTLRPMDFDFRPNCGVLMGRPDVNVYDRIRTERRWFLLTPSLVTTLREALSAAYPFSG